LISQFRTRDIFGSVLDFRAQAEATAQGYHKRQRSCVECSCSAFRSSSTQKTNKYFHKRKLFQGLARK